MRYGDVEELLVLEVDEIRIKESWRGRESETQEYTTSSPIKLPIGTCQLSSLPQK
jgi:hypothetical protein